MITLTNRLERIEEPQTLLMAKKAKALKDQGIDLVDLSLGEPDFATPKYIIEAANQAMLNGFTKYPPVAGIAALKKAIVEKLKRDNNLEYNPNQIVVSTGAKQSLANAIMSLVEEGDEVLIPTPYWVTYNDLVQLAHAKSVFIPCGVEDKFKVNAEKLEAAITNKTKLFVFSSPCNPSGAVYSREELERLVEVFKKYPNIYIISDEIYEYINYVEKHESIASFEEIKDRVILINGFSKGFAMTGWRLGYMAAHPEIAAACEKFQGQITSGANIIAQKAGVRALSDLTEAKKMTEQFRKRRDYFVNALRNIEGIKLDMPDGAFYAFPDISYYFGKATASFKINNANDFTDYLLNIAHVTGVSGSAFGLDNCIRFSFAASIEELEIAINRIKNALEDLK